MGLNRCFGLGNNTGQHIFDTSDNRPVLGYIWGADFENDINFFTSALVFEIWSTPTILIFTCCAWVINKKEVFKVCFKTCQMHSS